MTRRLSGFRRFLGRRRPVTLILWGYTLYIATGFVLLCLPFSHQRDGLAVIDHLFIATSAVSTTGLVTISPSASYSLFGEIVILALIQLGGIGYMTLGSFVMLAVRHRLDAIHSGVAREAFVLPRGMDLARFIRGVVLFTVAAEICGTGLLWPAFHAAGVDQAFWQALFHAVSAFCTAGFSLFDDSLEGFRDNVTINLTVAALSYLGAIGFIVMTDWWRRLRYGTAASLTSRVILRVTVVLAIIGTLAIALTDPALVRLPAGERWLAAFFQTMTAMTTVGFDTYPIARLGEASIVLVVVAMVMGASPSGTGGGIKSTTVALFYAATRTALAGQSRVTLLGQRVSTHRLGAAMAVVGFYLGCLLVGIFALLLVEAGDLVSLVFEAASALGTVGLSLGVTGDLSTPGKLVIIVLMFLGRLGPITVGTALFPKISESQRFRDQGEDIAV